MMFHPSDPVPPRAAILRLALLREQKLLDAHEVAPPPGGHLLGWPARWAWAVGDARRAWAATRRRAAWAAREALAPLLTARASRAVLEDAVAAADPSGALTPGERAALLAHEVEREIRRVRR